jgi:hypothetical protein
VIIPERPGGRNVAEVHAKYHWNEALDEPNDERVGKEVWVATGVFLLENKI